MKVLFLSVKDLESAQYLREKNKNLLKTDFCIGDTIALCGKLENVEKTDYGPRFWINDADRIGIIVGTFNKKVRKDAEKIAENFKEKKEDIYLLLYGNPYFQDKVYINVNSDNGALLVDKKFCEEFHDSRVKSKEYSMRKAGISIKKQEENKKVGEGKSYEEKVDFEDKIMNFVKSKCLEFGFVNIDEIEKKFSNLDKENLDKKILELLESGKVYEPKPGMIKLID